MTKRSGRRKRARGEIEALPSGSPRVRVYAGIDPVSKKKHDLSEVVPAGPAAPKEAEKARIRLLAQVDERRHPRTRASVDQLLDRWLEVLDVEVSTRQAYVRKQNPQQRGPAR
jgi:integrase